jgi:hypothetical protein
MPYVLEEHLVSKHYLYILEDELPLLLEDVHFHIRQNLWLQQDGTFPYFGSQVTAHLSVFKAIRLGGRIHLPGH